MRKALKNTVLRALRGGSYFNVTRYSPTTDRRRREPKDRGSDVGFRLIARRKK